MQPVVSVEGLRKAYGNVLAADDVGFAVLLRGAWFGEPWPGLAASAAVVAGLLVVAAGLAAWRFRWEP